MKMCYGRSSPVGQHVIWKNMPCGKLYIKGDLSKEKLCGENCIVIPDVFTHLYGVLVI